MMKFQTTKINDISLSLSGMNKITFECKKLDTAQFSEFKEGKTYDVEIKEHKEKRSMTQNAYLWVLINSLAEKLNIGNEECYKHYIRQYGHYDIIAIKAEAVDEFIRFWNSNGIGNMAETFSSKIDGCINVKVFYGSSKYNTAEMSRLIEGVVWDCKEQGITTLTPKEVAMLANENDRM